MTRPKKTKGVIELMVALFSRSVVKFSQDMSAAQVLKNGDVISLTTAGIHGSRGKSFLWADDLGQLHVDPSPRYPLDQRYKFAVYKFIPQRSGGNQDPIVIYEGDNVFVKSLYTGRIGAMHSFDCGWDMFRFNFGESFALGDYLGAGEGSITSFTFMSPYSRQKGRQPVRTDGSVPYSFMNTGRSCFASVRSPSGVTTAASANIREMFQLWHQGSTYGGGGAPVPFYPAQGPRKMGGGGGGNGRTSNGQVTCPKTGLSSTDIVLTSVAAIAVAAIIGWAIYETLRKKKE